MKNKVILISIDGMRPDGVVKCGNPYVSELMKTGSYSLTAKTVFPSVTLPCHMSMFHSVRPERHGITTNIYMPMVRPLNGLFEQIHHEGGRSIMYYGWEPLRDISRPEALFAAKYLACNALEHSDAVLTDAALDDINTFNPDFVFLYMVETDIKGGHGFGWMSETYLSYISHAIDNVKRVIEAVGNEYTVIVTADHGGHDRVHGTELPEDMTIPMFFHGKEFEAGRVIEDASIIDIAPTIAQIMDVRPDPVWEGKSLLS